MQSNLWWTIALVLGWTYVDQMCRHESRDPDGRCSICRREVD